VLALSTMFNKDIYQHLRRAEKTASAGRSISPRVHHRGDGGGVRDCARIEREAGDLFEIRVRYAFSGFAAMAPVMVAALFWKRSTKWARWRRRFIRRVA